MNFNLRALRTLRNDYRDTDTWSLIEPASCFTNPASECTIIYAGNDFDQSLLSFVLFVFLFVCMYSYLCLLAVEYSQIFWPRSSCLSDRYKQFLFEFVFVSMHVFVFVSMHVFVFMFVLVGLWLLSAATYSDHDPPACRTSKTWLATLPFFICFFKGVVVRITFVKPLSI